MNKEKERIILAGDIGGTKTNLGLFVSGNGRPLRKCLEVYQSRNAMCLEHIIDKFLNKCDVDISAACFGIAGPVIDGKCKTTNLPWSVSENILKKKYGWTKVNLINDLVATACSIPLLKSGEYHSINKARPKKNNPIALIAPGTGLGQALLIYNNNRYIPMPSEGGHVDFAPNNAPESELWDYLHKRFGHVSIERVVSGNGIVNIYSWLKNVGKYREPQWLLNRFIQEDPTKVITEAALDKKCKTCMNTINIFISILGAVAGNLALTGMTSGGIYIGGGIPPKILPLLTEDLFFKSLTAKGRFQQFLEGIPVRVILNDKAALLGAAHYALEEMSG